MKLTAVLGKWPKTSKINVDEAKQLYISGKTLREIACIYDVSAERVRQKLQKIGVGNKDSIKKCIDCGVILETTEKNKSLKRCLQCRKKHFVFITKNYCACGKRKTKKSKQCNSCSRGCKEKNMNVVLKLWNEEGKTLKQIAEILNTTKGTISQYINRSRKKGVNVVSRRRKCK